MVGNGRILAGSTLSPERAGFPDRLNMEPKRKRGVECGATVWGLTHEMLLLLAWWEEAVGAAGGQGAWVWTQYILMSLHSTSRNVK